MPDTLRSESAILALFADNTSGDISPQDLRDFVVSVNPGHGSMYVSGTAATTITIAGTYYKAAGTTTLSGSPSNFDMPADNRLRYTGSPDIHVHLACSISYTCGANNQVLGFKIYKYDDSAGSGATDTPSNIRDKIATGADIRTTALHADFMMSTNDYVELHVTNETSTNQPTIDKMYLFCLAMFD